jgi:hypothetical protein
MKKEFVLQLVENSASSIFSREDVIKLINSVEGGGRVISVDDIQRAIDQTVYWIENNSDRLIDEDSAEFELDYNNRVTLSNVNIDVEEIREALENNFMDFGEAVEEDDLVELSSSEYVPVEDNEL